MKFDFTLFSNLLFSTKKRHHLCNRHQPKQIISEISIATALSISNASIRTAIEPTIDEWCTNSIEISPLPLIVNKTLNGILHIRNICSYEWMAVRIIVYSVCMKVFPQKFLVPPSRKAATGSFLGCMMFARDRIYLLKCFATKKYVRQFRISAIRKNDSANQRSSTIVNENNYIPTKATQPQPIICNVCNSIITHKWQYCEFPRALNSTLFAELLPNIDTFIFDADGVLWVGETPIVGSREFFEYLTKQDKQIIVLTNNSNRSRRALMAKMHKMGFIGISENSIVNPAAIIIEYLSSRDFQTSGKTVYLIGSQGFREDLDEGHIEYFGCGPDPPDGTDIDQENLLNKDAFIYRIGLDDPAKEVGAVIVGFEKHFNYVKMMRAANFLQDEHCLFLGTNEDETSPGAHPKTVIPDTGPILAAVKMAAGREPIVVGKPHAAAFRFICSKWGIRPHRTMMFGDRSNTDIIFGRRYGMRTTLVLSGVHSLDDVQRNQRAGLVDMVPDYYAPCLGSIISQH